MQGMSFNTFTTLYLNTSLNLQATETHMAFSSRKTKSSYRLHIKNINLFLTACIQLVKSLLQLHHICQRKHYIFWQIAKWCMLSLLMREHNHLSSNFYWLAMNVLRLHAYIKFWYWRPQITNFQTKGKNIWS